MYHCSQSSRNQVDKSSKPKWVRPRQSEPSLLVEKRGRGGIRNLNDVWTWKIRLRLECDQNQDKTYNKNSSLSTTSSVSPVIWGGGRGGSFYLLCSTEVDQTSRRLLCPLHCLWMNLNHSPPRTTSSVPVLLIFHCSWPVFCLLCCIWNSVF